MCHAVFEGIPERRVGEHARSIRVGHCGAVARCGSECSRHCSAEAVVEIGEVLLPGGTEEGGVFELFAVCFVVAGTGHVRDTAGDGGELVIELLDDGFVGVDAVEEVLGFEVPVIGVSEVPWVDNKLEIVDVGCETGDGCVVERGVDAGDRVAFRLVHFDGESVGSVHA